MQENNKLISGTYLVERKKDNNQFDFCEMPKEEMIGITIHKE